MAKRRIKRKYIDAINSPHQEFYWLEILGIFFIAFSVFLLVSFMVPSLKSSFSLFFQNIFAKVFGWAYFLVPFLLVAAGLLFIFPQNLFKNCVILFFSFLIVADFSLFFHLYSKHGGWLGHRLSAVITRGVGVFGAYVVFAVVLISSALALGRFSLKEIMVFTWNAGVWLARAVKWFVTSLAGVLSKIKLPNVAFTKKEKPRQLTICPQNELPSEDAEECEETIQEDEKPTALQPAALQPAAPQNNVGANGIRPQEAVGADGVCPFEPKDQIELFPGLIKSIKEKVSETIAPIEKTFARKIRYKLPSTNLLAGIKKQNKNKVLSDYSQLLVETLQSFGVEAKVIHIERGPTVTRYELQPARGVKVSKITNLSNDIALVLAAQSIRIEAPIPGKSAIGIEIPNKSIDPVHVKEILESRQFKRAQELPLALGKDITGNPIVDNLIKMPHLLIAGATGSGKTVCINTVITSLLFKYDPSQVQFLMIDPKRVELILYEGIPHLVENDFSEGQRIVTDPKKATLALKQLTVEMDKRYKRFAEVRARNIYEYNNHCKEKGLEQMPYLVLVIDELADLMLLSAATVETSICRLAQLGRASGIHLILATQRPSVDVITGLIKANIPSRIAFAVSSQVDSRTIIDRQGSEKLLGRGDMLYMPIDEADPKRLQGAYIDQEEIERVVDFWANQPDPNNMIKLASMEEGGKDVEVDEGDDAILNDAINIIRSTGQASTSFLQRKLRIGYARASRIMDILEQKGIVGPAEGSRPRKILITIGHTPGEEEK